MGKFCYGCMSPKNNSPICEHCGYNENLPNYPNQLPIGTVLNGQYLIGKVLGQGGFGITYIGWDLSLETTVAIKEYYPKRFASRDCTSSLAVSCIGEKAEEAFLQNRERFIAEAKIQAKLSLIPGIVQIQRLFEENNTAYIVMEYVRGIHLKQYMQILNRSLTLEETFAVMLPVISAMEKIHEAELVHQDISPDNIMIQNDGTVKLLDFGAAFELGGENTRDEGAEPQQAVLKHGFAPIEQYGADGNVGPWTDVYALCATFYYCLTGTIPEDATERYLGNDNIDWTQISELTASQITVLKRGLSIHPEYRIAAVWELRKGLLEPSAVEESESQSEDKNAETETADTEEMVHNPVSRTEFDQPTDQKEQERSRTARELEKTADRKRKPLIPAVAAVLAVMIAFGALLHMHSRKEANTALRAGVSETVLETMPLLTEATTVPTEEPETVPTEPPVEEPAWKKNVLIADATFEKDAAEFWQGKSVVFPYELSEFFGNRPVFNTDIPRKKVTDIFFLDSLETAPEEIYDVSANQDASVLAWTEKNRSGLFNLYIAGEGGVNGEEACRSLFYGYEKLLSVNFGDCFFTDTTQDMSNMFTYCTNLKEIDLSSLNTGNVTDMSNMFGSCEELQSLDLSSFDTSNVVDMSSMFSGCRKLKSLDISSFDTSNVQNMSHIFSGLKAMKSFDLSHFDTSKVTNMAGMFYGCNHDKFTALDVSSFDTSSVTDMSYMFFNCPFIQSLDLSNFDTSNVMDMQFMFYYCRRLTFLDLSSFDTSNVTNMQSMFEMCNMIPVLEISHFDTAKVIDMSYMFYKCGYLKKMDVTKFDVTSVKDTENMFFGCDKLSRDVKKLGGKSIWPTDDAKMRQPVWEW